MGNEVLRWVCAFFFLSSLQRVSLLSFARDSKGYALYRSMRDYRISPQVFRWRVYIISPQDLHIY